MDRGELEKFIRAEIKKHHASEIDALKQTIKKMENQIASLEIALNRKIDFVNTQINKIREEDPNKNDKQLIAIEEKVQSLVVSTIEETIQPQLNMMKSHFGEMTLDGTQVVTEYRNRVMGVANTKLLPSGNKKQDFQASMFAFTDAD